MGCNNPIPKNTPAPITIQSLEECYQFFRQKGKNLALPPSKMLFGPELLPDSLLSSILLFNLDSLKNNPCRILRKGAFQKNGIYFFIYGLARNEEIQSVHIRSIWRNELIDDQAILRFKDKSLVYDYMIDGDYIHVRILNAMNEIHSEFYSFASGKIELLDGMSEGTFHKPRTILWGEFKKRIRIFNNYQTKELVFPNGQRFNVTGNVVKVFGGHGFGAFLMVKLDTGAPIPSELISIPVTLAQQNIDIYAPTEMFLLESDSLVFEDYTYPNGYMPLKEPSFFMKNIFIEVLE